VYLHSSAAQDNPTDPTFGTPSAPSAQDIATYVGGLPATSPLSIESNTIPVGAQSTPTPSDSTASTPVPATGLSTPVVPASSVQPTDVVVNPNATPPPGTTQTKTETDTAPVSCAAGNHEQRTFGSILQDHLNLWAGSGLLSALNLLKTLTWPTAIPTYSLQSTLLGTFTLDFSAWSGMLTAIRSIIIAIAGFVAYKIVFVGAR